MSRTPSTRSWTIASAIAAAIASMLGTSGCTDAPPDRPKAAEPTSQVVALLPAPQVEIAGCEETLRTPLTCRPSPRDFVVRFYVPGHPAPTVRVEPGEPRALSVKPHADGGALVEVKLDEHARALVVETAGAEPWRIALEPMPAAPALDALHEQAAQASDAATLEGLLPRIDAVASELPEERRVDALRLRMLLHHQLGRVDAALEQGEAALDLALRTGRVGATIDIAQVLAFGHLIRGNDAAARWLVDLQTLHAPLDVDASRKAGWHYYRGILACHTGDLRTGLVAFEESERIARRLADGPLQLSSATQRVILLGALGRSQEQRESIARVLEIVESADATRCDDAQELDNIAWALLSDHGTAPPPPEVDALFDSAEHMLVAGGPCDSEIYPSHAALLGDIALGRGLAALGRDDRAGAKEMLDRVAMTELFPAMPPWLHYARGVLALRDGRIDDALDASAQASQAAAQPGAAADPDPRLPWRLALLRGQAHARAGDRKAALRAFLDAERIADRLLGAVGVDQGREGLATQALEGSAQAIDLLLAEERFKEAAELARRSRGRTFRPIGRATAAARLDGSVRERFAAELDAYRRESERIGDELQEAWRLDRTSRDSVLREHADARAVMRDHLQSAYALLDDASDPSDVALPSPAKGELWLLWHPRADGWAAFAITSESLQAETVPALPPSLDATSASELLLQPFDAEIAAARSVLVLPVGSLHEIDFAALPWNGDALLASRPVAWKLDLARDGARAEPAGKRALVVGDPATRLPGLGRLPEAAKEAENVAELLGARGFDVMLRSGDEATASGVMSALSSVDLLHWAGHGRRGDDGWDSRLPLAGEAALDVRDVLALASVPHTVVLTGCETGRTDRSSGGGGMHLAAGFVVSGARLVVAANAEVDDSLARDFGTALYMPATGMPEAGIEAVRQASLHLRRAGRGDFTAFRAWVP